MPGWRQAFRRMSSGDRGALLTGKAMKTWLIGVVDTGVREGITTSEAQRMKELKREVKELRRANEILKLASAFFAQAELDRRLKS